MEQLVQSFHSSASYVEEKIVFMLRFTDRIVFRQAEALIELLDKRVQARGTQNLLITRLNPLKIIFLLIKLLQRISTRFSYLQLKCAKLEKRLSKMGCSYIEKVHSRSELRRLLDERTLEGERTLELVVQQENMAVMGIHGVQEIILDMWDGPYELDHLLRNRSKHMKVFFSFLRDREHVDYERVYRCRRLRTDPQTSFNFLVWKKGIRTRFFLEALFLVIVTLMLQIEGLEMI